jgi:hypothetical protein
MPILALCGDLPDEIRAELTAEKRQGILDQLPATLQMVAAFWRQPDLGFPRRELARSSKVGRSEPCPLRLGQEIQEVLRRSLAADAPLTVWSSPRAACAWDPLQTQIPTTIIRFAALFRAPGAAHAAPGSRPAWCRPRLLPLCRFLGRLHAKPHHARSRRRPRPETTRSAVP